jgi:hypothetical protein
MSSEKELLSAFLSKTLNMDDAGVASLYKEDGSVKEDALTILESMDVERVNKLRQKDQLSFDNGYKKGQSESLSKLEKEFIEKTGFKADKKGLDLFLEYAADISKKAGSTLTEDEIKKNPLYISAVEKLQREREEAIQAKAQEFEQFKSEIKKKETFSTIERKALDVFASLKPVLSKDEQKAANQQRILLNDLSGYEYDIQGDKIVVLKEGKVLEDAHGFPVKFEKVVKDIADKYYDFQASDAKSSPANGKPTPTGNPAQEFKFEMPKNDDEYMRMVNDPKLTTDQKLIIKEAYRNKTN